MSIRFGTDGWRGIIGADFTFDNLARLGRGIVNVLPEIKSGKGIVIGYDTRFLSREFAYFLAEYLGAEVSSIGLFSQPCPTPVLSYYTKKRKAALGIMLTASHNPFYYNGVKFKMGFGGPPVDDFITRLEEQIPQHPVPYSLIIPELSERINKNPRVEMIEDFQEYFDHIFQYLDNEKLSEFKGSILYNAMNGSGLSLMPMLLKKLDITAGYERCEINPLFHQEQPEPIPHLLQDFSRKIPEEGYSLGIATDGDADRVGIFDEKGQFVDIFVLTALLYEYLVSVKNFKGGIAYSASLVDIAGKISAKNGYPAEEVPVGFKHVAKKLHEPNFLMAAEESGGIGYNFHIPERDGIFSALLLLEMMTYYGKPVSQIVNEFLLKWGNPSYGRIDFYSPSEILQLNFRRLKENVPERIGDITITHAKEIDGIKWYFDGGWVLMRISQTEPVGRIYATASSQDEVRKILALCRELLSRR